MSRDTINAHCDPTALQILRLKPRGGDSEEWLQAARILLSYLNPSDSGDSTEGSLDPKTGGTQIIIDVVRQLHEAVAPRAAVTAFAANTGSTLSGASTSMAPPVVDVSFDAADLATHDPRLASLLLTQPPLFTELVRSVLPLCVTRRCAHALDNGPASLFRQNSTILEDTHSGTNGGTPHFRTKRERESRTQNAASSGRRFETRAAEELSFRLVLEALPSIVLSVGLQALPFPADVRALARAPPYAAYSHAAGSHVEGWVPSGVDARIPFRHTQEIDGADAGDDGTRGASSMVLLPSFGECPGGVLSPVQWRTWTLVVTSVVFDPRSDTPRRLFGAVPVLNIGQPFTGALQCCAVPPATLAAVGGRGASSSSAAASSATIRSPFRCAGEIAVECVQREVPPTLLVVGRLLRCTGYFVSSHCGGASAALLPPTSAASAGEYTPRTLSLTFVATRVVTVAAAAAAEMRAAALACSALGAPPRGSRLEGGATPLGPRSGGGGGGTPASALLDAAFATGLDALADTSAAFSETRSRGTGARVSDAGLAWPPPLTGSSSDHGGDDWGGDPGSWSLDGSVARDACALHAAFSPGGKKEFAPAEPDGRHATEDAEFVTSLRLWLAFCRWETNTEDHKNSDGASVRATAALRSLHAATVPIDTAVATLLAVVSSLFVDGPPSIVACREPDDKVAPAATVSGGGGAGGPLRVVIAGLAPIVGRDLCARAASFAGRRCVGAGGGGGDNGQMLPTVCTARSGLAEATASALSLASGGVLLVPALEVPAMASGGAAHSPQTGAVASSFAAAVGGGRPRAVAGLDVRGLAQAAAPPVAGGRGGSGGGACATAAAATLPRGEAGGDPVAGFRAALAASGTVSAASECVAPADGDGGWFVARCDGLSTPVRCIVRDAAVLAFWGAYTPRDAAQRFVVAAAAAAAGGGADAMASAERPAETLARRSDIVAGVALLNSESGKADASAATAASRDDIVAALRSIAGDVARDPPHRGCFAPAASSSPPLSSLFDPDADTALLQLHRLLQMSSADYTVGACLDPESDFFGVRFTDGVLTLLEAYYVHARGVVESAPATLMRSLMRVAAVHAAMRALLPLPPPLQPRAPNGKPVQPAILFPTGVLVGSVDAVVSIALADGTLLATCGASALGVSFFALCRSSCGALLRGATAAHAGSNEAPPLSFHIFCAELRSFLSHSVSQRRAAGVSRSRTPSWT